MMRDTRVTGRQKEAVSRRARGLCEYCRSPSHYSTQVFSAEHIIPRSAGGPTAADNLALACQGCNNHKYTKTEAPDPATNAMVPLYHPRRDRWSDHFRWSRGCRVVGRTATGRATIRALGMNRPVVVAIRKGLVKLGRLSKRGRQSQKCNG